MSTPSTTMPRVHSALTADEARAAIVMKFSKALDAALIAQGVEGRHTTFVNAEWVGGVKLKAFLRKATEAKVIGSLGAPGESDVEVTVSAPVEHKPQSPALVRVELKEYADAKAAEVERLAEAQEGQSEAQAAERVTDAPVGDSGGADGAPTAGGVAALDAAGGGERPEEGAEVVGGPLFVDPGEPPRPASFERLTELHAAAVASGQPEAVTEVAGAPTSGEVSDGRVALNSRPDFVPEKGPAALLDGDSCQFCQKSLSANPHGIRSHMRTHVRDGVAEEYEVGGGGKAWRAK